LKEKGPLTKRIAGEGPKGPREKCALTEELNTEMGVIRRGGVLRLRGIPVGRGTGGGRLKGAVRDPNR